MHVLDIDGNEYLLDLDNAADVFDTVAGATRLKVRLDKYLVEAITAYLEANSLNGLNYNDEFKAALDWQLRGL